MNRQMALETTFTTRRIAVAVSSAKRRARSGIAESRKVNQGGKHGGGSFNSPGGLCVCGGGG